ncbi:MAG: hypothetical protein KAS48_07910 [Gammaproteobacteria bacterium]|nr:hypothetical protein [Gammaproteobacteria bacterium]MCK5092025.1 hypothetical protein [Gammaproteobacteria bacterium]
MGTVHKFQLFNNKFRRDRYFNVSGDGWYLEIREGIKGPFITRESAEKFLKSLKRKAPLRRVRLWVEDQSQPRRNKC